MMILAPGTRVRMLLRRGFRPQVCRGCFPDRGGLARILKQPDVVLPFGGQPPHRINWPAIVEQGGRFGRLTLHVAPHRRVELRRTNLRREVAWLFHRAHIDLRVLGKIVVQGGRATPYRRQR